MELQSYEDFLNEAQDRKLSLAQETIQKKRALEDKKDQLLKKLKDANDKDDAKSARSAKLLKLQIKKIENQIEILLIDEQIKEMTKK
jgi:hypothetical protein